MAEATDYEVDIKRLKSLQITVQKISDYQKL